MAQRQGERIDGPTPNGGVYALLFRDGDRVEIHEYDKDDEVIATTYGNVGESAAQKLHKAVRPRSRAKSVPVPPPVSTRTEGHVARLQLAGVLAGFFEVFLKQVQRDLGKALASAEKLHKALDPKDIDSVMGQIDFTVFNQLPKKIQPIIEKYHKTTGKATLKAVGVAVKANKGAPELNPNAFDQVNAHAVKYAEERSAELVGMKYVNGYLQPNPNAIWRIDEGTREGIRAAVHDVLSGNLRQKDLSARLSADYAFSPERADMIAITEVHRANGEGALSGYRASGVVREKTWLLSPSEQSDICDECQENADEGPIPLDEEFPSGDLTEPAHPNCRCAITGSVNWDDEEED